MHPFFSKRPGTTKSESPTAEAKEEKKAPTGKRSRLDLAEAEDEVALYDDEAETAAIVGVEEEPEPEHVEAVVAEEIEVSDEEDESGEESPEMTRKKGSPKAKKSASKKKIGMPLLI